MATQQGGAEIAENLCPTITAAAGMSGNNQPCVCTEEAYSINHQGGKEEQIIKDKSGTLTAAMNSSGNNKLSVCYPINTMVASRTSDEKRTTFGIGDNGDPQFTLQAAHEHAVCYGICSQNSNSMKSSNPDSGIYEADTSRTLDCNGGNPACNQGGIAVCEQTSEDNIYCIENSTGRNTLFMTENVSPTLVADEHNHACCVPETVDFGRTADRIQINPNKAVTLQSSGGGMGAKTGLYCIPETVSEPIGVDIYNLTTTGDKSKTILAEKSDIEHVGGVLCRLQPRG